MIALAAEDLADLRRWALSAVVVVTVYGSIAAAMVAWHDPVDMDEPAAGIVIELSAVPVARVEQTDAQPGPDMVMSDASPDRPTDSLEEKPEEKIEQKVEAKLKQKVEEKIESKPVEEPPPEVPPAPNPEVAVPPPPPQQEVKQDTPQRQEPRPPAPTNAAPRVMSDLTAAIPAAPVQGVPTRSKLAAEQSWNRQIAAVLRRVLRYPPNARGQTGKVMISIVLDRQGRVIESRILKPSGVAVLDEEALAIAQRAQPFPPPPAEVSGERIKRDVPVNFLPAETLTDAKR